MHKSQSSHGVFLHGIFDLSTRIIICRPVIRCSKPVWGKINWLQLLPRADLAVKDNICHNQKYVGAVVAITGDDGNTNLWWDFKVWCESCNIPCLSLFIDERKVVLEWAFTCFASPYEFKLFSSLVHYFLKRSMPQMHHPNLKVKLRGLFGHSLVACKNKNKVDQPSVEKVLISTNLCECNLMKLVLQNQWWA